MSGLEAAGVIANILQIAEIGFKLSVSLYNLYHKLQSANQNLRSLSSDISLTCNVLQQLGSALKQDEQKRLCSPQALSTAKDVLEECKQAFQRIDDAVRESSALLGMNRLERAFRRFAFVLKESELDALHGNLESLKSTMLLMLNVLIYAGQIRSRSASSVLLVQQDLIKELIQERRIYQMQESELASAQNATVHGDHGQPYNQVSNPDLNPIVEMEKYYLLIRRIFSDIDACKTDLERERYHRIRNGVELLHLGENNKFDAGLVKQLESRFPDLIPSSADSLQRETGNPRKRGAGHSTAMPMVAKENGPPTDSSKRKKIRKRVKQDPLVAELIMEWTTLDEQELE